MNALAPALSADRPRNARRPEGPVENLALFQAGWCACVMGAALGAGWVGVLAAIKIAGLHVYRSPDRRNTLALIALVTLGGTLFDGALASSGLVQYTAFAVLPGGAPLWIAALWALFATTLHGSLAWMKRRPALAALLGAVGGPLSYWAGQRIGALAIPDPETAFVVLAAGWALVMPVLMALACRFERGGTTASAEGS